MPDTLFVLWDIDHTLLQTRGVGGEVFAEAFEAATGRAMSAGMAKAAGHTEPVLLRKTLHLNGITEAGTEVSERFFREQAAGYRGREEELRTRGRVLPGVEAALRSLDRQPHVLQSVLTGNTQAAARIKLATFGLDHRLDLDVGAYGDDDEERPALVRIAMHRAQQQSGIEFQDPRQVVLIGDTPKDVDAAKASGVRVIGVASGSSAPDDLREAGADRVLGSLDGVDIVALLDAFPRSRRGPGPVR